MLDRDNNENQKTVLTTTPENLFQLLPDELVLHIIQFVPHTSLFKLMRVNKAFHGLCKDFLLNNKQPPAIKWRLSLFKRHQEDLREDIEEEEEEQSSCTSITSLFGAGFTLAGLDVWKSPSIDFTVFAAVMLAALVLIICGTVKSVQVCRSHDRVNGMYKQIDDLEMGIAENRSKLHNPPLCPTHSHRI